MHADDLDDAPLAVVCMTLSRSDEELSGRNEMNNTASKDAWHRGRQQRMPRECGEGAGRGATGMRKKYWRSWIDGLTRDLYEFLEWSRRGWNCVGLMDPVIIWIQRGILYGASVVFPPEGKKYFSGKEQAAGRKRRSTGCLPRVDRDGQAACPGSSALVRTAHPVSRAY